MQNKNKGPVRTSGLVLKFGLGLDMDCGRTAKAGDAGSDVEVTADATQLKVAPASPQGGVAWVEALGAEQFDKCAALSDSQYQRAIDGLDKPAAGRSICVRTSEGNIAILRPDAPAVPGSEGLDLHYAVQYPT